MAYFYPYPEIEPYPTTHVAHTYPEKGHHLHHIPIPYLVNKAHKVFHDHDTEVHVPKADIRETLKNFYLEVELPGIKDKSELHLRWTSTRTLLVTSKTHRPDIPESELLDEQQPETGDATITQAPDHQQTHPEQEAHVKREPHLTVHERPIGDMMRAFNFPIDVDRDNTHAKLDAGLLKIVVPKLVHGKAEENHLPVPVHDGASEDAPADK